MPLWSRRTVPFSSVARHRSRTDLDPRESIRRILKCFFRVVVAVQDAIGVAELIVGSSERRVDSNRLLEMLDRRLVILLAEIVLPRNV